MTTYYKNVYIDDTATVCGPYEKKGPLRRYFDKCKDDLYIGEDSYEKAGIPCFGAVPDPGRVCIRDRRNQDLQGRCLHLPVHGQLHDPVSERNRELFQEPRNR